MKEEIQKLAELIKSSGSTVFFGGAGLSTESGIPDFRGADGIYSEKYGSLSPEEIISGGFFRRDPETFFKYYKSHLVFPDAKPNRAHIALARLEKAGFIDAVITQNIDGLHSAAGSEKVYELHGTVLKNHCVDCKIKYGLNFVLTSPGNVPRCPECGGIVRPDVTLYDEMLPEGVFDMAARAVAKSDLLIVGGTSLAVYPAASLLYYFKGSAIVVINLTETPADSMAELTIHKKVGDVIGDAADIILSQQ